jgi:hypothetical protein
VFVQGGDTMSMMPPEGLQRIDRRLIHQMAWKVHPRKPITAILHRFANGRAGVGREK